MDTTEKKQGLLRAIPKVDEFLGWLAGGDDESRLGGDLGEATLPLIKRAVRETLDIARAAILDGSLIDGEWLNCEALASEVRQRLALMLRPKFTTVINATGVVIHTNLGRSLLPDCAMDSIMRVGRHYSNLEFDLATGKRGSRYALVEDLLCELTGAEAALVVNNNAAAVLLVLGTLAAGREVVVSRGQLVEIGGSFRIPEVMERSGARLVEVGATNRTHLRDYEQAISSETALLLKVHTSNYRMIGFTSEVPLGEMVSLGARHGIPVMEDLGSGSLVDLTRCGLVKEPTVGEVVMSGVDVVTFSGDKLLGGPQAGLIVGRKAIIDRVKRNPLNRALRIDKFTLAGLEGVLRLYRDERAAMRTIPTLVMLSATRQDITKRAVRLKRLLGSGLDQVCQVELVNTESRVGGGAMPEQGLPSKALALRPLAMSVNALEQEFRQLDLPIIGRIERDALLLDLRTVSDQQVKPLAQAVLGFFRRW
ncbi:MAG: L-seryl-tRNA(Sec) selenium transferase [Proteobacteria bacterium]|nr:L-seryl-tRNA(Sec) selenium transferase [Desulfobulbaceae bacterium]MBU4152635.1 L-seryl-tRNA(Sec) selenium transferase [Pseudomonadota bacterium]MDP2105524.1 L-seryl-tRNA(Sec) selenium transferase [Desulfobulbaceae bacterium]